MKNATTIDSSSSVHVSVHVRLFVTVVYCQDANMLQYSRTFAELYHTVRLIRRKGPLMLG